MDYTLNTDLAKEVGSAGKYITLSGKYIGQITEAKAVKSKKNSNGIELAFRSDDGREANYLTLWTQKDTGEPLYGLSILNALMTVMRLRGVRCVNNSYPDLLRPVGLVMQREESEKPDGSQSYRLNIMMPFDPQSELTAKEIIGRETQPEQVANAVQYLAANPVKQAKRQQVGAPALHSALPTASFDDDIPF